VAYARLESTQPFRAASQRDAEAVCRIYNAALEERHSTFETEPRTHSHFEERIDDNRLPFLVADANGSVVGWAGLAPYSARPCYAGIAECSVYVAPMARGRGVGTALTGAFATGRRATAGRAAPTRSLRPFMATTLRG
jgi:L-amino acid N-acyltransferase YncA